MLLLLVKLCNKLGMLATGHKLGGDRKGGGKLQIVLNKE